MSIVVESIRLSQPDLSPEKIVVKHSGLFEQQYFKDPDGDLVIVEIGKSLPIADFRRIYWRYIDDPNAKVGYHAHKQTEQYIFCTNGSFELHLDDGENEQDILVDVPQIGVKLGPRLWHSMSNFERGNYLVLANSYFDKNDYIRDYQEFLEYIRSH